MTITATLGSYQHAVLSKVAREGIVYPDDCNPRELHTLNRLVEKGYIVLDDQGYRLPTRIG